MEVNRLQQLFDRWLSDTATEADEQELMKMLAKPGFEKERERLIGDSFDTLPDRYMMTDEQGDIIFNQILAKPARVHRVHFLRRFRWAAAAIFLLLAGTTGWFLLNEKKERAATTVYKGDVLPGHDGAKLKLSDGRIILIDTLKDGLIAIDGQVKVYKANGKIVYKGEVADAVIYNELIAEKGRQTSAQLPDGSTVWLNAGSSIRYPLQFSQSERLVTMTGEASFRVIHNEKQPFRVKVKDLLVEDIGTEFNINAYDNEPLIRTTLVEGSASVTAGGSRVVVNAGKEANLDNGQLKVADADVDKAIAWRNGLFNFDGADVRKVGRQLERWYDIEVVYERDLPTYHFGGGTYRNSNLKEVLKVLELGGVHFRLERGEAGVKAKLVVMR